MTIFQQFKANSTLRPLSSLDTIFNMIQQEESHKKVMLERDNQTDNMAAFAAKEQPMASERPTCKHCGRYGHEETNCYEILGYP